MKTINRNRKFLSVGIFGISLILTACGNQSPIQVEQVDKIIEATNAVAQVADAAGRALDKAGDKIESAAKKSNKVDDNLASLIQDVKAGKMDITGCYVIKIADGDTATCLMKESKKQVKIRFAQIDAPESKQEFGTRSKQALSDLIFNKNVDLKVEEVDRYGRTVAEVFVDGMNVNKAMVKNGFAWAYKEYNKDPHYLELQEVAKARKEGLWAHKNPMYPQDFRKQQAREREAAKANSK